MPTTVKPSVCIGVDNEDSLFVAGDYIVTHNSYWAGNAVIGHEFLFHGYKRLSKEYFDKPSPVEIFVGAALSGKSGALLSKMSDSRNHQTDDLGAYGKGEEFEPGFFYVNTSGTLDSNNEKNPFRQEYDKKEGGTWKKGGNGTSLVHGNYKDNPESAVGTRPTIIVVEETGLMTNLLQSHASNETCQVRSLGLLYILAPVGTWRKSQSPKSFLKTLWPSISYRSRIIGKIEKIRLGCLCLLIMWTMISKMKMAIRI